MTSRLEPDLPRLFASLAEGLWQRDLVTDVAWYSPRYKQLLGFADDELANDRAGINERVHPDDRDAIDTTCKAALASLQPRSVEARMLTRSGEWRWFRSTGRVWLDDAGRPSMLVGSLSDVHAEKQAALDMKALADRFDRAMAASAEAHFERTAGERDFFMSPRIATLLGHPPGTPGPSSETYLSWVHPEDLPALLHVVRAAAADVGPWEHDYRLRCADGSYRWFGGRGRSERDAEGRLRMTGMIGDIHEHKLAQQELALHREQLRQLVEDRTARLRSALELAESRRAAAERANLAKATFLAHMSHELRTPLNGVLGMTQLAERGATSDTQRRYLQLAMQSGHALLRILDDVLDFSRAEAGKLQLVAETFDLPRLVAETVRGLIPQMGKRPLHMLFDCVGDPTHVVGDPGRVRQIVSNLVGNAIKFTRAGAIEVVIELAQRAADRCAVHIEVRDSGVGMDAATLRRVFEPFEQADNSTTRQHGGTGLGLPIVRLLAQRMGGDVRAHSEPGAGSVFTVELDLGAAGAPPEQESPAAGPTGHAWLIYVDPIPARWVQRRLARIGLSADVLVSTRAALDRLRHDTAARPDCVIIADQALGDTCSLAALRRALPPQVPISLLLRPDFALPNLQEAAPIAALHLAIAPLTCADLRRLVRPEPAPAVPGKAGLALAQGAAAPLILVVEDLETNRLIICEMLRVLGMRVGIAASGEEALQVCRGATPDLVLMDIQMPGMDGLEAARRLRVMQREAELPPFPIVALTANAMDTDREASRDAGMDDHLAKPLDLDRLRDLLAHWLPAAARVG